jgi:pimeloyl-ACP methyl ester carboxylesterase
MERLVPTFREGIRGLVPDAWIVGPLDALKAPPVVVVHGITRAVDEMVAHLLPRARATGRTLILPHFSEAEWPRYQRAACPRRADWALLRLISALEAEGRIAAGPFDLSGFSGGAQFAHRFAWLYPDRVGRLCATAPGWWTFPDPEAAWPYGMGGEFRLSTNLRRFLARRIVVCVGSDDTARDDNLRKGAEIDARQGPTRVGRARRWYAMAETRAREVGIDPAISLRVLQGCGHSFADCVAIAGLDRDFVPHAPPCAGCSGGPRGRAASTRSDIQRIAA